MFQCDNMLTANWLRFFTFLHGIFVLQLILKYWKLIKAINKKLPLIESP